MTTTRNRSRSKLLAAALLCACFVGAQPAAFCGELSGVVPSEALVFVEIRDLAGMAGPARETVLYEIFESSELLQGAVDAGLGIARLFTAYVTGSRFADLREVLMKDVALVIFDLPEGARLTEPPPIALVADASGTERDLKQLFAETIKPHLTSLLHKSIRVTSKRRGAYVIETVTVPNKPPASFAFLDDVVCFGAEAAVQRIADAVAGEVPVLAANDAYVAVRKRTEVPSGVMLYVDINRLIERAQPRLEAKPKEMEGFRATGIISVKALGASTAFDGPGMRDKVAVYTGDEAIGMIGMGSKLAAAEFASAKFVPREHGAFVGLNFANGPALQQAIRQLIIDIKGQAAIDGIAVQARNFENMLGMSFQEQIIEQVGGEFFVAAKIPDVGQLIAEGRKPNPRDFALLFGLSVKNQDTLADALNSIIISQPLFNAGVSQDTYTFKEIDVTVLTIPKAKGATPSYAFVEGYLLFALFTEDLEKALDAYLAKETLATNEDFTSVRKRLPATSQGLIFADLRDTATALSALLAAKAPPKVKPFVPAISEAASKMFGLGLGLTTIEEGLLAETYSPVGGPCVFASLLSAGMLGKSRAGRGAEAVKDRMKKIRKALRRYRREQGAFPQSLDELVPKCIEELPGDPFAGEVPFEYAQTADGNWILLSVGPDGKQDLELQGTSASKLRRLLASNDPADVAQMKASIFQHRKKAYADERGEDDEGDIVMLGP